MQARIKEKREVEHVLGISIGDAFHSGGTLRTDRRALGLLEHSAATCATCVRCWQRLSSGRPA
jgi:hypothetical protein